MLFEVNSEIHVSGIRALGNIVAENKTLMEYVLSLGAIELIVKPSPATRAIWAHLKAGETMYQAGELTNT